MTYCLAICVDDGIVFCSDSRTNAGVDHVSTYSKQHRFGIEGERQLMLLSAGNLGTTQSVVAQVKKDIDTGAAASLHTATTMSEAADYIGRINRAEQAKHTEAGSFGASFILGGQIRGGEPQIHMIYSEGNHITSSQDTPYLQVGESKYGKPILDRILSRDTELGVAALCALVSMDSTMRSNITVGPPIEVQIYHSDSFEPGDYHRFEQDSDYLREVKRSWDTNIKAAFKNMPPIAWAFSWDRPGGGRSEAS